MKKEKQIKENLSNEINPEGVSFNLGFTGRSTENVSSGY